MHQDADRGRLTGAVSSEKAESLAAFGRKRDILEYFFLSKTLAYVA